MGQRPPQAAHAHLLLMIIRTQRKEVELQHETAEKRYLGADKHHGPTSRALPAMPMRPMAMRPCRMDGALRLHGNKRDRRQQNGRLSRAGRAPPGVGAVRRQEGLPRRPPPGPPAFSRPAAAGGRVGHSAPATRSATKRQADTGGSRVVPHLRTDPAQPSLTSGF